MAVSSRYEATGRTRQKARTRAALLAAARELLRGGVTPTVEQAAEHARISRTTAYRYFGNQRALLAATYPELEATSLLGGAAASDDPATRLDAVLERMGRRLLETEAELRAQLRLSLEARAGDEELPLRQGRAIAWLEEALEPLSDRLGDRGVHRLALAIRAAAGIEAFVWLVDVARVSREDALEIMRDSAHALLRDATSRR